MLSSKSPMLSEVDKLIELGLYDSAETLTLLCVSHLANQEFKPLSGADNSGLVIAELYERLADALFEKREIKRALQYYRSANNRRRSQQPSKHRPQFQTVTSKEEASLKYKECKCLVELKDFTTAVKDLDSIPGKFRDGRIHLLLGDLYKRTNSKRSAIIAYKEALATAPYAIEVIESLVDLGVEAVEILPILDDALRGRESTAAMSEGWLHTLVAGLVHKRNHEMEKSFAQFNRLAASYPQNTYLMIQQASVATDLGMQAQAMTLFKQVRKQDVYIGQRMEIFGQMLFYAENARELSRLADEVLDACPHLPTGWLLASMFSVVKGDGEAALAFADKAVKINPLFSETFKFKGQIFTAQEAHDQALIAFSQANRIEKDMASFTGMVAANLELGKTKEAAACAREALSVYPRSSMGYMAMGLVFSVSHPNSAESLSAYAKALQLNPLNKIAAAKMAEVLVAQGKAEEAAACLVNILSKVSCHKLRLALGTTYASLGRYREAIENVHIAISLDPSPDSATDSDAAQELERIEQLLRAENADEEEEEEEEQEEEEEGGEYEIDEGEFEEVPDEYAYAADDNDVSGADEHAMRELHGGGHSLLEDDGNPFGHSGAGIPRYAGNNASVSGTDTSMFFGGHLRGSVDSADDSDLQRALSQSLLDPYGGGGGGPGEDSSGFEDDGIMYASLDNSAEAEGGPSTPRRWS